MERPLLDLDAGPRQRRACESLDFEEPVNSVSLARRGDAAAARRPPPPRWYGYSGRSAVKVATTLASGVLIGLTAHALQRCVEAAIAARNGALQRAWDAAAAGGAAAGAHALPPAVLATQLAIGLAAVLAAGAAVQLAAPGAASSGVPRVMAVLNGVDVPGLLTPRVFCVKFAGTVAARAAGLALGMEGPMVHLGAAAASVLCVAERRLWRWTGALGRGGGDDDEGDGDSLGPREPLFTLSDHREIVTAGAAAGLAAAFGAPVGGVLFALEEASSSLWFRATGWRCFLCAAAATFTLSQLSPHARGGGLLALTGVYPLSSRQWLLQLPAVVAVAAAAAAVGAAFNAARRRLWAVRASRSRTGLRLAEAAAVSAATSVALLLAASRAGRCLQVPEAWEGARRDLVRGGCPDGAYNDAATALLGPGTFIVRLLLGLGSATEPVSQLCTLSQPCYFSTPALAAVAALIPALMAASCSLCVPGGLFMPSLLAGGALGAAAGGALRAALPASWGADVAPGVYAIVGATAMLAAVFRSSISLVVIVLEGTSSQSLSLGVITAVVVSNWVAHHLHKDGVYESELERDGAVYFLRQDPPHALRALSAGDVMASPAVGLPAVAPVAAVRRALAETTHSGFPVFPPTRVGAATPGSRGGGGGGGGGRPQELLVGFILRSQLRALLAEPRLWCDEGGRNLAGLPAEEVAALEARADARSTAAPPAFARDGPAPDDGGDGADAGGELLPAAGGSVPAEPHLSLAPLMHLAPLTVRAQTPAARLHQLFLSLSLRHVCVVDQASCVLGIVTRKDLDNAAGRGYWRAGPVAPTPAHGLRPPAGGSGAWLDAARRAVSAGSPLLARWQTPAKPARDAGGDA